MKKFSEQVKKRRMERKFSQGELADLANISRGTLVNIEKNQFRIHLDIAVKLATILEISLDELKGE